MEAMSSTTCPHGLSRANCEICRILEPSSVPDAPHRTPARAGGRFPAGLATVAIVMIVGFLVVGWVSAAVWAVLRILQLVAVAAVAGWIGYQLGVRRAGRGRSSSG